jgi:hypothetical protein
MTVLGYILLPVGLAGLCLSTKLLYRIFVFWTLFSATAVMNFGEGEHASALQVWMFFGFLWLLRLLIEHLSTLSFSIDRRIVRQCLWLIAFLSIATLSLIMPVYINGSLAITSWHLGDWTQTPLYLTSHNFTQLLYLIFGGTIAICVAHSNLREEERHGTERIILLSAVFVSIWGLFQFFCNLTGIPYPDFIFNNSASGAATGFMQTLDNGVSRVSSVATEPSVFAESLIVLLPLTFPAWLRKGSVMSITADRYCTILFMVMLVLCTSSTAYLGLFLVALATLPLLVRTHTMSSARALKFAFIVCTAGLVIAVVVLSTVPIARNVIDLVLVDKGSSGSALERARTVELAFGYFQKYPILGVGWGSLTCHDLIVNLLSSVGIIGATAFLGAILCTIRASWRASDTLALPISLSRFAWLLSISAFILISIFAGFPFVFGNFWLVVGMAIATSFKTETLEVPPLVLEPK